MAVILAMRQNVAVSLEAMVGDSYLNNSATSNGSGIETCSTWGGNSTEENGEVCILGGLVWSGRVHVEVAVISTKF